MQRSATVRTTLRLFGGCQISIDPFQHPIQRDIPQYPNLHAFFSTTVMSKPGRNDPCFCGSGKKYKHCCLSRDQDAATQAAVVARQQAVLQKQEVASQQRQLAEDESESMALDNASNRVLALIKEKRLDQAEAAARDLLQRYPEIVDGFERLAAVYEARGQLQQAASHYRQALDFVRDHAGYDAEYTTYYQRKIAELEAPKKHDP